MGMQNDSAVSLAAIRQLAKAWALPPAQFCIEPNYMGHSFLSPYGAYFARSLLLLKNDDVSPFFSSDSPDVAKFWMVEMEENIIAFMRRFLLIV